MVFDYFSCCASRNKNHKQALQLPVVRLMLFLLRLALETVCLAPSAPASTTIVSLERTQLLVLIAPPRTLLFPFGVWSCAFEGMKLGVYLAYTRPDSLSLFMVMVSVRLAAKRLDFFSGTSADAVSGKPRCPFEIKKILMTPQRERERERTNH